MDFVQIAAVFGGFVALVLGADRFVLGASATARTLGVSPLIIGLVIVGFGTSAPEMLVSGVAGWEGNTGLAIGNAIGSNITNIALVLGASALVAPLAVRSDMLRREFPVLFATMLLVLMLLMDDELGRIDGLVLLVGLGVMIYWVVGMALRERAGADPMAEEFAKELPPVMSITRALIWLAVGLIALMIGARIVVWGAVGIAQGFGVSDLVIGLTIVAIGTSLPELAASVMSAFKGEHDIAIGNVIGSNMFNLLGVLGIPAVIHPAGFDSAVLSRDYPVMAGLTLVLFAMAYGFRGNGRINRVEGGALVGAFFAYLGALFYMSA